MGHHGSSKKRRLINQIRTFLSRYFAMTDKHKLLRAVFTKNFDHGLHVRSKDYLAKSAIIENISQELNTLRRKEHQSGAFQAVLSACCGSNISSLELARQLKVHRHSVRKVFYILKKPLIISFLNSLFFSPNKGNEVETCQENWSCLQEDHQEACHQKSKESTSVR